MTEQNLENIKIHEDSVESLSNDGKSVLRSGDEFLTSHEVSIMFRVSNSTVNLWKKAGMPFYGKSSCARFLKSDVIDWQKKQSALPVKKGQGRMKKKDVEVEVAMQENVEMAA